MIALIFFQFHGHHHQPWPEINRGIMELKKLGNGNGILSGKRRAGGHLSGSHP